MLDLSVSVSDHCLSFYFEGRVWDLIVSVYDHCLSFFFEGRVWDLIVSVPDHCLSFYFEGRVWDLIVSVPDLCLSFYFNDVTVRKRNRIHVSMAIRLSQTKWLKRQRRTDIDN